MGDSGVKGDAAEDERNFYRREMNFKIFDNRSNCKHVDVYLVAKMNNGAGVKIPAHKVILGNCQFFDKFFQETRTSCSQSQGEVQGSMDLQLESDPISIELILKYIYTGQLDLNGENLMKLLAASKYFELPKVTEKCMKFLHEDESDLIEKNWLDLFRFAVTEGGRGFRQKIFEFLRTISGQIIHSEGLITLDREEIKILLEPVSRVFKQQDEFNKAILKWIISQPDRQNHVDDLSKLNWSDTVVVDLSSDNEDSDNSDQEDLNPQGNQQQLNNENDQNSPNNNDYIQNNQDDQLENIQMAKRVRLSENQEISSNSSMDDSNNRILNSNETNRKIIFLVEKEFPCPYELFSFSLKDKTISKLTDMPTDNVSFGLISNESRLFLLGGCYKTKKFDEMFSFSLNPDQEPQMWKKEINLSQKLSHFSTTLVGDTIYMVGGQNDKNCSIRSISLLKLNYNTQWTTFFDMKETRFRSGSVVLNNILYVSGGLGSHILDIGSEDFILGSFEMINLDTKVGTILSKMKKGRYDHRLIVFNDKFYAIGGVIKKCKKGSTKTKSIEVYDLAVSKKWTSLSNMHDARSKFVAFTTEDHIFVLGGNGKKDDDDPTMEKYDPLTNSWSQIDCPEFPKGSNFDSYNVHITD